MIAPVVSFQLCPTGFDLAGEIDAAWRKLDDQDRLLAIHGAGIERLGNQVADMKEDVTPGAAAFKWIARNTTSRQWLAGWYCVLMQR